MYIGNQPYQVAFVTDTFNGTGSATVFTMSVAPANTASVLVAVSGVLQDPSTYSVSGTTLTFSAAPPSGTGNISCRYLGIPASGVTTTAYRTVTEFTATAGQTTFTPPSYTAGFINVYRNGVLLGSADYTATNGTTVVLATGAAVNDLVTVESFLVSSVLNAIPATAGSVGSTYLAGDLTGVTLVSPKVTSGSLLNSNGRPMAAQTGGVLQVVSATIATSTSTSSTSFVTTGLTASITPSSTSSKILAIHSDAGSRNSTGGNAILSTLYRNGANVISTGTSPYALGYVQNNAGITIANTSFQYLDSPASASSVTYAVYCASYNTAGTVVYNAGPFFCSLILMEIAG